MGMKTHGKTPRKTTTTTKRMPKHAPVITDAEDELDDDAGSDSAPLESRAVDPLAAEPLTSDEIERLQAREPEIAEEDALTVQTLQQETEATMPVDTEGDATREAANDQELDVRRRPRAKDRHP
jgi:hypothetical protein